jgi:hypothetical protein
MNKIASIYYLMDCHIPTCDIHVIDKEKIDEEVKSIYYPRDIGWAVRCGEQPDMKRKPEGPLPWASCHSLKDVTKAVKDFYKKLKNEYVFIHPQRDSIKSGNLLILGDISIVEVVEGFFADLSHGKVDPRTTYIFKMPSLFLSPDEVRGDENFLSREELSSIGDNIVRRLDYSKLPSWKSIPIEFSYDRNGIIDAHDVRI